MPFCAVCGEFSRTDKCGRCYIPPKVTVASLDVDIHAAIGQGDYERVVRILDHSPEMINQRQLNGFTPLHNAVFSGKAAIVRLLLERGADARARSRLGDTPLHLATRSGHKACMSFFKTDINLRRIENHEHEMPFDHCSAAARAFVLSWDEQDYPKTSDPALFCELPEDILHIIFEMLPLYALLKVQQVCRGWFHAAQDDKFWRKLCLWEHGDDFQVHRPLRTWKEGFFGRKFEVPSALCRTMSLLRSDGLYSVIFSEQHLARHAGRHPEVISTISEIRANPEKWKDILSKDEQTRRLLRVCLPRHVIETEWHCLPSDTK